MGTTLRVILQPVGSRAAQAHFEMTVGNPVPVEDVRTAASPANASLVMAAVRGPMRFWGISSSAYGGRTKFRRINSGDFILFVNRGTINYACQVAAVFEDSELALALWGTGENGETWDLMLALESPQPLSVPIRLVSKALGDRPNYTLQSIRVLDEASSAVAASVVGLSEDLSNSSPTEAAANFDTVEEPTPEGFDDDEPRDLTTERWLAAQRDIITTTLDYNLQTIAELVRDGTIDLSPSFQRRQRWDVVRKSRLIESFLMNVPMPPVFLNEDEFGKYSIIDGKQRFTAVSQFMSDELVLKGMTVFSEANGSTFSQLDPSLQSVLRTRASLRAVILLRMSDPLIKYHVFQRLNTGGVRLNAQEVRNVAFEGPLNQTIITIANVPRFQRALGISATRPETSAVWREMRDVELVLRYLTLSGTWRDFRGSLAGAMNDYMSQHQFANRTFREACADDFNQTLAAVISGFGDSLFRRWSPRLERYGQQPLATLFDAQMIAARGRAPEDMAAVSDRLVARMQSLFEDEQFSAAIGAATNTPIFVQRRIEMVTEAVAAVLES